ncbi:class I adenylate-forming enzyme family protein [Ilumatobacter nonamiensis]|uniref:class I adenylate-forming enzyme family protein n=1 Tax=Ilumatobacter nonamiensis TaxID=467093 RepID=UPI000346E0E0|nr:AMP-binding protein [Ilumatobacter nonamiensis]
MTAVSTFAAQWAASVAARPSEPFLRFEASDGTVTEWSYAEFDDVVGRTATTLVAHGVDANRGVHLALTNSPSFVAAWLAAIRLGSYIVPSDPMATAPELAEHVSRTCPAVSLVSARRAGVARGAIADVGDRGPTPLIVDEDDATCAGLVVVEGRVSERTSEWPDPAPTDRAAVMFTSGTTGRPKGVEITQANYAFAGSTMAAAASLDADDRQLVVLPLFHANAQYYSFASAIAVGAGVALMSTFSASGFVRQAAVHGATHASLFAGPMRMILARGGPWQPEAGQPELRLRHCWFAQNITSDQYATISDWLGCRPRQLYGMTETIPAVLTDSVTDPRHDSMGFVTDGCSVQLHDAAGLPVSPGEVGQIVVGGEAGTTLFAGYLDDPDTTAASYRDGWFLTGDRARCDADGRFVFDGRRSDVLKVSGENVSVVEVEAVVGSHPDVFDVVVVGAPDPIRDEVPVAFVVPEPGVDRDGLGARLDDWSSARLGKAKRPRDYSLVDELPRTSVGKVRKFLLTEAAADLHPDRPSSSNSPSQEAPA